MDVEDVSGKQVGPSLSDFGTNLSDSKERQRANKEAAQEFSKDLRDMKKSVGSRQLVEDEKVYLKSNRPQTTQILTEGISIPGKLSYKSQGPYQVISQDDLYEAFRLQDLMTPNERGYAPIQEITREEYEEGRREWNRTLQSRINSLPTPADVEREDSEFDKTFDYRVERVRSPLG